MSDLLADQYEDYLVEFHAWGREFLDEPLSFEQFEELSLELEMISTEEDCGPLSGELRQRREEIERTMLTHDSYFVDGPRIVVTRPR